MLYWQGLIFPASVSPDFLLWKLRILSTCTMSIGPTYAHTPKCTFSTHILSEYNIEDLLHVYTVFKAEPHGVHNGISFHTCFSHLLVVYVTSPINSPTVRLLSIWPDIPGNICSIFFLGPSVSSSLDRLDSRPHPATMPEQPLTSPGSFFCLACLLNLFCFPYFGGAHPQVQVIKPNKDYPGSNSNPTTSHVTLGIHFSMLQFLHL